MDKVLSLADKSGDLSFSYEEIEGVDCSYFVFNPLKQRYNLKPFYILEKKIASLVHNKKNHGYSFSADALPSIASEEQKKALENLLAHPFSLLTGGPGTGKTFCASLFIDLFFDAFQKALGRAPIILLTAPTGKAASHLYSKVKETILPYIVFGTLHKVLGLSEDPFKAPSSHLLAPDLCIVDESSMLSSQLLYHLLNKLTPKTHLVLMGDPDQLPPVAAGSPFSDLVYYANQNPSSIAISTLSRSHRVKNAPLLDLADAVKQQNPSLFFEIIEKNPGCLKYTPSIDDLFHSYDSVHHFFHLPLDHASPLFLTPINEGPLGQKELNQSYLDYLKKQGVIPSTKPIIATRNNYRHHIMNGEIGYLKEGKLLFSDNSFSAFELSYELAYAISMHKSQGSEFSKLALFFPTGTEKFGSQLLYTAITRAKQSLALFGQACLIEQLILRKEERCTALPLLL